MNGIPKALRRVPQFFYVASAIFFVWYLGNTYVELVTMPDIANGLEGVAGLVKSKTLFEASLEALYLVANGAMIHVLIAIYDKLGTAE
jgi:hypothetical protein